MPEPHQVVITGMGVVSPIGNSVAEFRRALEEGRSGIRPLQSVSAPDLRFSHAAEAVDFDASRHFDPKQSSMIDRFAQMGIVAARQAIRDSGRDIRGTRTAVVTGSSVGGQCSMDQAFVELYGKKSPRVNPMMIPKIMGNAAASQIAMEFGITGPAFNISTACASSTHAIGQAFWMVRSGQADTAVCGGAEAFFSYGFLKAWEAMRVVSPDTCRPFSRNRKGLILGEGSAMLVLETLESAHARGATIHAEVVGFGMTADAYHITQPSAEGPAEAMRAALRDGRVDPKEVGYISAHGTGTQANDATEAAAIVAVFGASAGGIPVSSTKSMHGHALGAAGALEALATAVALEGQFLPPTVNFEEPDPACSLDVVPNRARTGRFEYALSNSFAFGGLNAVLLFARSKS